MFLTERARHSDVASQWDPLLDSSNMEIAGTVPLLLPNTVDSKYVQGRLDSYRHRH